MITIYKILSPSGRIYIGQSMNFNRRQAEYKRNKCKAQHLLYNSFIKYGYESHIFEVIEKTTKELADEREIYWIKHFDCFNTQHGLNLTTGGKRPAPKRRKEHYKAKIIYQYSLNGLLLKKWDCISEVTDELGYNSTIIGKSIKSTSYAYGFLWSFEKKEMVYKPKNRGIKNKCINQYDLNGNLINTFNSIVLASKILKLSRRTIQESLQNKKRKIIRHKFIWKYV